MALVVVAAFSWALLLWVFAAFGPLVIGVTCFGACAVSGAVVGSQIARLQRRRVFTIAAAAFALVVVLVAVLGRALPTLTVFVAALFSVALLSGLGFFAGGWLLTLKR